MAKLKRSLPITGSDMLCALHYIKNPISVSIWVNAMAADKNFEFTKEFFKTKFNISIAKVNSSLTHLKELGYLKILPIKKNGKYIKFWYVFLEHPGQSFPYLIFNSGLQLLDFFGLSNDGEYIFPPEFLKKYNEICKEK